MAGGGPAVAQVAEAALANHTQAERQGETMAMVAALESIPQMVRRRLGRNIARVGRAGRDVGFEIDFTSVSNSRRRPFRIQFDI